MTPPNFKTLALLFQNQSFHVWQGYTYLTRHRPRRPRLHILAYNYAYFAYFAYSNMQNMQNIDLAVLFAYYFAYCCIYMSKKYANAFSICNNMQKNMQTLNPICKILQGLYSAYSAYICTAQFADEEARYIMIT